MASPKSSISSSAENLFDSLFNHPDVLNALGKSILNSPLEAQRKEITEKVVSEFKKVLENHMTQNCANDLLTKFNEKPSKDNKKIPAKTKIEIVINEILTIESVRQNLVDTAKHIAKNDVKDSQGHRRFQLIAIIITQYRKALESHLSSLNKVLSCVEQVKKKYEQQQILDKNIAQEKEKRNKIADEKTADVKKKAAYLAKTPTSHFLSIPAKNIDPNREELQFEFDEDICFSELTTRKVFEDSHKADSSDESEFLSI